MLKPRDERCNFSFNCFMRVRLRATFLDRRWINRPLWPHCIYSSSNNEILIRRTNPPPPTLTFSFLLRIHISFREETQMHTRNIRKQDNVFFIYLKQGEMGREEEEMWSGKTRAQGWPIGEDGHCRTENEKPNLLWRFPWARLWRSAPGCEGTMEQDSIIDTSNRKV